MVVKWVMPRGRGITHFFHPQHKENKMSDVSASVSSAEVDALQMTEELISNDLSITVNSEPVTEYIYEQPATYID